MTSIRRRAELVSLVALFVLTRIAGAWLADHPERYRSGPFTVITDITLYESWASAIVDKGRRPYAQVAIEYPPGMLPFVLAPRIGARDSSSYRRHFIALMLLVDVAGIIALWRIARKNGSTMGLWLWTTLVPLVGPLAYARLDLVTAVATIWSIERAAHGSWLGAGAFLGYGAMAKVYPALLLPLALLITSRRRDLLIGAALAGLACLALAAGALLPLFRQVAVYHTARGISFESTWGALMLLASQLGYDVEYRFAYGALLVESGQSGLVKYFGMLATAAAIAMGALIAFRMSRDDARGLAHAMFATLAMVLGVASVFSPQFVIWLIAIAAAALAFDDQRLRRPTMLLVPVAATTQLLYPWLYGQLVAREPVAVALLVLRNALILCAGVAGVVTAWRSLDQRSLRRSTGRGGSGV